MRLSPKPWCRPCWCWWARTPPHAPSCAPGAAWSKASSKSSAPTACWADRRSVLGGRGLGVAHGLLPQVLGDVLAELFDGSVDEVLVHLVPDEGHHFGRE